MADKQPKRLYWLKLKEGFFGDKCMKKLRRMAGGDTYTIIYLKLLLLGLRDGGRLYFDHVEDTFSEELALEMDEEADDVQVCLMFLLKNGLLEEVSETELFLTQSPEMTSSESESAERVRRHRRRKALAAAGLAEESLHCNRNEISGNTDIDIEKEIQKDIYIEEETRGLEIEAGGEEEEQTDTVQTVDNVDKSVDNMWKECAEVVQDFNRICWKLQKVRRLSDERKEQIEAALKVWSREELRDIFQKVADSAFLCGEVKDFRATFRWIMKPETLERIGSGQYRDWELDK